LIFRGYRRILWNQNPEDTHLPTALYRRHSPGLAATYADIENHALSLGEVLIGTPGSVSLRRNAAGVQYWVRQYYDFERRKRDQYVVAHGADQAEDRLKDLRDRIRETQDLLHTVRLLAREGYATLTPRHFAVIARLANAGLFRAGAILVGTHAYESILNRLGIRAEVFATEDIDIARNARLAIRDVPAGGLLEILRGSGIDFVEVSPFDPRDPPIKFKERGRSRFTLDLLVPARGDEAGVEPVPELAAHAAALPYFRYLLGETQMAAALSSQGAAGVRIPVPERYALHKLIVSRLRRTGSEKSFKDLRQAAILIAAVGENLPGALERAYGRTPVSARSLIRKSLEAIRESLSAHPQAWEELAACARV
jgi:hypothetical protein